MSACGRRRDARAPFARAHAIEIDGLRVTRGGRLVLPGLDLRVPKGEVVGLLGPSGGGKSTVMRAVVGVQRVDALDGVDVQGCGVEYHPPVFDGCHQERSLGCGRDGSDLAADDESVALGGGGQARGQGVRGNGLARGQAGQQAGFGVVRGDQRTGDGRWDEWAGDGAVAEFGEHDGQFEDAEALTAGGNQALIVLGDQVYNLRITRAGKLILTK